ncbi:transporter substrate-binding domain-containing protein [Vibrio aestuarianus]|uniref:ABC transporter substrate-binding protein n=1 Tax=Vibrio aestuarianus TaxID=28171 RepID=A0ABM9FPJ7_9VIBR|nr:transporter substrate-binding domain-containing protein [Vibrio aestuarianus]MDE1256451.1 transporter substrate-binding domain-containing protein [Vibrio aestuarianus]MDH5900823.1 transporter substrate-binding domain-containing protein [Vibrio aestuarianus]MDH5955582.1 transporter substrate-binding domain-containing protein [Vibrio aestuarianus]MDH5982161.1 transporter substrate-binding domain-containing protein [Vibrio aestuarianus]MDH6022299.1 transporter substrate-binding domain-containi
MIRVVFIAVMLTVLSQPALAYLRPERLLLATQEWFPYQYQENGEMKGPGIERVKCVMRVMDQPYQLTMTKWDRAQLMTEVGAQHGFFLASRNSKRDEYADYSVPLDQQNWSWFSLSDSTELDNAMFKSQIEVAALFGSNKWFWLQKNGYRVSKKPRTPKALIELMLNGEVGAVLGNDAVIDETIKKMGISYRAISRTQVKSNPLWVYFSKAFTKKYPNFLNEFNEAVSQCR